ncbi:unnamed protein product [Diamesa hyperborea]
MESTKEQEIEEEYLSSLTDLNVNSKPLINMLTMLAEENIEHAPVIVKAVEKHLAKSSSDVKLPILYLIDSIVKNVGKQYKSLFSQNIVNIFCGVFEKVNEKVREKMFNLRLTWNEVFPLTKLYALDVKVKGMDGNWPITAELGKIPPAIHVNPHFIKNKGIPQIIVPPAASGNEEIQKQVEEKERELLILQKRKIELEVIQFRKKIEEQEREIKSGSTMMAHMMNGPMGQNRTKIAPVNQVMVNSARLRDPRLANRMRQPQAQQIQQNPTVPPPLMSISTGLPGITTKSLPRIPKFAKATSSQSNESRDRDDRDPRSSSRRRDDKSSSKSSSSKDSKRSDSRSKGHSSDRKKSISSDESPRKKGDEDKKSPKSRIAHTKNSPSKSGGESKDVDLRVVPGSGRESIKSTNDKLLKKLLLEDSKDNRSTDNNVFFTESAAKQDIDLRFTEMGSKKRSMTGGEDVEPTTKKNKSERVDLLFGNEDVDLRTLGVDSDSSGTLTSAISDKKNASKAKDANFQALRAKLMVASTKMDQDKIKLKKTDDVKLLENGTTDVAKLISMNMRKDKLKLDGKEHQEDSNSDSNHSMPKRQRFIPDGNMKNEIPVDFGMMTAAELRNDGLSTVSIDRAKKRKESKWNPVPANHNQQVPQNQQPFASPWENINPHIGGGISDATMMLTKLKNDASIPLVTPQSPAQPILNNKIRTVRLDGTKDHLLRFYNETAIIFNESGEPHDIKFSGGQSHVIIDEVFTVVLSFNNDYQTIVVNGKMHRIKFGKPTRELYIDDQFYECYFNNMTTKIMLDGSLRIVRIDGKVPEVKIGRKRCDLVLGRINMVIDAEVIVPVFLDTTLQYFEFKGKVYTLQFADFFLSVVLNNDAYRVEFGGLPKNFQLNGEKHFLRFTALPDHIEAGHVNLRGMRRTHLYRDRKSPPLVDEYLEEAPPVVNEVDISKLVDADILLQKNDFTSLLAAATMPSQNSGGIPGIGNDVDMQQTQETPATPNLNINELLQKLVATGILGGTNSTLPIIPQTTSRDNNGNRRDSREEENKRMSSKLTEQKRRIDPISLSRPETIKKRQLAIVELLYIGIQCSSCGLRFPPEQTMKYSQHLDWHFRQNRRERDSQRRAHSRKWYYNCSDWIKYEEIEDLEEREKNFFETQMEAMDQNEDSNQGRGTEKENAATTSCAAGPDDLNRCCEVCHDTFEQFFNEETEEWHLRAAIKMDDKFYHPICYEDYKASLTMDESALLETTENTTVKGEYDDDDDDDILEMKDVIVKEEKPDISELKKEVKTDEHNGENNNEDDYDDDVIVMPTQEPIITEVLDDTDMAIEDQSEPIDNRLNMTDDDVMINEPKIETQNLVDDEDDDSDEDFVNKKTNENPDLTLQPIIVKIKEEPKDDGYEDEQNEEDNFVEVTTIANDDFIHAEEENAVFDDTSLHMLELSDTEDNSRVQQDELMDADEGSRPETNPPPIVGGTKKLKIVLSSLAQNNLTNKNSNANSNSNVIDTNDTSNNLESLNKLDDNGVNSLEAQNESSMDQQAGVSSTVEDEDIEFEVKPQLQGIKFEKQLLPVKRGFENSGLCSIM